MPRCSHCGETMSEGQENCFACGQHFQTRAYRHKRRVNPLVIIGACAIIVFVFVGLWLSRASAARKQAALQAEQQLSQAQDSARHASREWQDAVRIASNDEEARALSAQLDDIDSRFQSIRTRAASRPSPAQEKIIHQEEAELARLRNAIIVLASSPEELKPARRDSIQAGEGTLEELTRTLGSQQ